MKYSTANEKKKFYSCNNFRRYPSLIIAGKRSLFGLDINRIIFQKLIQLIEEQFHKLIMLINNISINSDNLSII